MACNCNKNRATASGTATATAGTYRVMVNGRTVYESSSDAAAKAVAERFNDAKILNPGESA